MIMILLENACVTWDCFLNTSMQREAVQKFAVKSVPSYATCMYIHVRTYIYAQLHTCIVLLYLNAHTWNYIHCKCVMMLVYTVY